MARHKWGLGRRAARLRCRRMPWLDESRLLNSLRPCHEAGPQASRPTPSRRFGAHECSGLMPTAAPTPSHENQNHHHPRPVHDASRMHPTALCLQRPAGGRFSHFIALINKRNKSPQSAAELSLARKSYVRKFATISQTFHPHAPVLRCSA